MLPYYMEEKQKLIMKKKIKIIKEKEIDELKESFNKEVLRLEIEGLPPTVNHSHINARGRRFRSKKCKDYQEYVINKIVPLRAREWPYLGRMGLTVVLTAADNRHWDVDNRNKVLQDCLERAGVIKNDYQIDDLHIKRDYGEKAQTKLILEILDSRK